MHKGMFVNNVSVVSLLRKKSFESEISRYVLGVKYTEHSTIGLMEEASMLIIKTLTIIMLPTCYCMKVF